MKIKKKKKVRYGTVSLPMPLIEKVKKKIEGTGMHSVSAYVSFVLRQIISSDAENRSKIINRESEGELKRRLNILGYS